MRCGNCGKLVDNDSTFCKYCGNKLDKVFICDKVYVARHWILENESSYRPYEKYISSSHYFLYQESAFFCFREAHRRAFRHDHEIRNGNEKRVTGLLETLDSPVTNNSINNSLMCWKEFTISPNGLYASHYINELSVATLIPSINLRVGEKGTHRFLFQYQEYIILDDSVNHHQGYVSKSEFYSSEDGALGRLISEKNSLCGIYGCIAGSEWDNRLDWRERFDEYESENNVYSICLIQNGHKRLSLHVYVSYCNDDNTFEMLYM